jgi:enoyl-CoA hydratase/carnithine racemase
MTELLVSKQGNITILTLNRPERHNALNHGLMDAMADAVDDFKRDFEQRVMIITGAGKKAFCAGGDLSMMKDDLAAGTGLPVSSAPDISGIGSCEKPVIAAINGLAVGGGIEVALCCDIRIAAESAWFGLAEVGHGFIAGVAAVLLPRLVSIGTVMDMMLSGERLSAADAFRLGLVQKVVPADALMEEALRKAERIARHSQPALWGTKSVVRFWRDALLAEHQRYYEALVHRVLLSGDAMEGLKAFGEKREPHFDKGWPEP